jgi:DNA-binding transcriptional ArsR family regulator/uncharacterized protein YndB with AHSA1/START domain
MAMDEVFKALADASRRRLLDKLFRRDGQTLGELEAHLPEMTRFGVMKHLRVLEEAGLVTTQRVGREKLHYLNPVPIRRILDRWTSKYARPFTRALVDLKKHLEGDEAMNKPKHVYEIYIRTTPQKLWDAITNPAMTRQYFYGSSVKSDWKIGSPVVHLGADEKPMLQGKVLEAEPARRLVTTFAAMFGHDEDTRKDPPSRVTWEIEARGEVCKLTVVHDDFEHETATYKSVGPGWNRVLSGLKTLLETGQPLVIAPSAS